MEGRTVTRTAPRLYGSLALVCPGPKDGDWCGRAIIAQLEMLAEHDHVGWDSTCRDCGTRLSLRVGFER